MPLDEFLRDIWNRIWDGYWNETANAWRTFKSTLGNIWVVDAVDLAFLLLGPVGAIVSLNQRVLDTIDALTEFGQDISLVPARVAVDVADDVIPVPDAWKNRIVRADQMIRFLVREGLDFAADIVDADLPAIVDVKKRIDQAEIISDVLDPLARVDDIAPRVKTSLQGAIALAILNAFKMGMALGVLAWIAYTLVRVHDPEESAKILDERALAQDSKRVRTRRARTQHRVNKRRGKDT